MDITPADVAIFSTGKTRIKYCHGKIEEVYNQTHAQASSTTHALDSQHPKP